MQKAKLKYYEQEIKKSQGDRWNCDSCKSEVRNKNENIGETEENSERKVEKDITLKDIMDKLQIMDQKQSELLRKYELQLKVNEELRNEIDELKNQIAEEKNKNEQRELENNIVISGIPQNKNEDPTAIVRQINQTLKINIEKMKCYRLGKGGNDKSGVIKVCFETKEDKESFLKSKKETKLTLRTVGLGNSDNDLYVNHDLTKYNQYLYMMARKFRRDNNYKYVWYSQGNIFLRKEDNSKVLKITREEDLKNY